MEDLEAFLNKARIMESSKAEICYETIEDSELTEEQKIAVERILEWKETLKQILTVGGYAGTGKTTLIKKLLNKFDSSSIAVTAFTGKAVSVLRRKGILKAQTLHSLMYEHVGDDAEGMPIFRKLKRLPCRLVIVDEASMISEELDEDLRSYGVKILYVGDHGQLEPIGNSFNIMLNPEIKLEKIHRQAEGSDLIGFAESVRNGQFVFIPEIFRDYEIITEKRFWNIIHEVDAVIVGRNETRHKVNKLVRERKNISSFLPEVGERVVCLKNSKKYGVYNGLTAKVTKVIGEKRDLYYFDMVDDVGNSWKSIPSYVSQYGNDSMVDKIKAIDVLLFDFGYAFTCHKAQGSEWDRVCVFEEIIGKWDRKRWAYTAVTRASSYLYYCKPFRKF